MVVFVAIPIDYKPENDEKYIIECISDWGFDITKEEVYEEIKKLMNPNINDKHGGIISEATDIGNVILDLCMERKFKLPFYPVLDADVSVIVNVTNRVWLEKIKTLKEIK